MKLTKRKMNGRSMIFASKKQALIVATQAVRMAGRVTLLAMFGVLFAAQAQARNDRCIVEPCNAWLNCIDGVPLLGPDQDLCLQQKEAAEDGGEAVTRQTQQFPKTISGLCEAHARCVRTPHGACEWVGIDPYFESCLKSPREIDLQPSLRIKAE